MSIESLAQYFNEIEDPRCSGKVEHRLLDVLVIAVPVPDRLCQELGRHRPIWPQQAGLAQDLSGAAAWHLFARHIPARVHADRLRCF